MGRLDGKVALITGGGRGQGAVEAARFIAEGAMASAISERIPMGRPASADKVASTVLFLASDESSYCSGHEYLVDRVMTA